MLDNDIPETITFLPMKSIEIPSHPGPEFLALKHESRILGHTGPQEKINPEKSCRTNHCVWAVGTWLGNMPEVILTPGLVVPSVPIWQNTVITDVV